MTSIKQTRAVITAVRELSPTAREYVLTPETPLAFIAGAFVNVFIDHEGTVLRRAFSISSSDNVQNTFSLSIRLSPSGKLTPLLWNKDYVGTTVRIMGPLGLNTGDKMPAQKIFLFGFGIGAGVVKSLADHIIKRPDINSLTIFTGNRSIAEIIHKDYFDHITHTDKRVSVSYIVSDTNQSLYPQGYIQNHVSALDFNHATVYMCGQTIACTALRTAIEDTHPSDCTFFVEDFH